MNIITKIKRTKKGTFIILDEEKEVWIEDSLIEKFLLNEKSEIEYEQIAKENYPFAYEKAMDMSFTYLSYCARSEGKMRSYLCDKKFDEDVVESVINRLKELSYIDDEAYIKGYIRQKLVSNLVGKKVIIDSLIKEGLKESLVEKIVDESYSIEEEYENALTLIKKVFTKNKSLFIRDIKEKAYTTALRKGFDSSNIKDVINEVSNDFSQNEEDFEAQREKIKTKIDKLIKKGTEFNKVYQKVYSEFLSKGADSSMIKEILEEYRN